MSSANILVVDDEDSIRHFVSRSLKDEGYQVRSAGDGDEARALFNEDVPDVVILDMKLGETETAVRAMSLGAFYFLKKPLQLEELNTIVGRGFEKIRLSREVEHLRIAAMQEEGYLRCHSPAMLSLYDKLENVAQGETTSVLIE